MRDEENSGNSGEEAENVQDDAVNTPSEQQEEGVAPDETEEPSENEGATVHALPVSAEERAKQQVEELAAKLRTVSKAYTDLQEEMDSFRQRQMQLADVKAQRKAGEVVEAFFEPVQNLKRCLETGGDDVAAVRQGVEMVLSQFSTRMDKLGLKEVPGAGSRFDPSVHNALALQPVENKEQDGIVLHVHAVGYAVGGRVIQPAQVIIGKYEEMAPTEA